MTKKFAVTQNNGDIVFFNSIPVKLDDGNWYSLINLGGDDGPIETLIDEEIEGYNKNIGRSTPFDLRLKRFRDDIKECLDQSVVDGDIVLIESTLSENDYETAQRIIAENMDEKIVVGEDGTLKIFDGEVLHSDGTTSTEYKNAGSDYKFFGAISGYSTSSKDRRVCFYKHTLRGVIKNIKKTKADENDISYGNAYRYSRFEIRSLEKLSSEGMLFECVIGDNGSYKMFGIRPPRIRCSSIKTENFDILSDSEPEFISIKSVGNKKLTTIKESEFYKGYDHVSEILSEDYPRFYLTCDNKIIKRLKYMNTKKSATTPYIKHLLESRGDNSIIHEHAYRFFFSNNPVGYIVHFNVGDIKIIGRIKGCLTGKKTIGKSIRVLIDTTEFTKNNALFVENLQGEYYVDIKPNSSNISILCKNSLKHYSTYDDDTLFDLSYIDFIEDCTF